MASQLMAHLLETAQRLTEALSGTAWRRMFGCDAAFVDGRIYALLWKEGRIGVKLPDPARCGALLARPGAAPWAPGGRRMSGWVLVPEDFHDDAAALGKWLREAHALVRAAGAAPARAPAKKAAAKKPASKTKTPRARKPAAKKPRRP